MIREPLTVLTGLGLSGALAMLTLWLMLRVQRTPRAPELVRGYPADRFPDQDRTRSGPLAALAGTQARLLAALSQFPSHSQPAVWVRAVLGELRELMDVAYRAAGIAQVYGDWARLEALAAEVQGIESRLARQLVRHAFHDREAIDPVEMQTRLAVLKTFVRELQAR
jgi:hypothetical protein